MSEAIFPVLNRESAIDSNMSSDYYKVSPSSLASIVIGVSLFWITVGTCLFYIGRGRKLKRNEMRRRVGHGEEYHNLENEKSMSLCMFDPESMVYIDGRPDVSPLKYENNVLDYAGLTEDELTKLEPENNKPLLLFSGQFASSVEEKVIPCQDGYVTRHFTTIGHQTVTVHYFRADRLHWFVNSVYSVMCLRSAPQFTIQHIRAVIFNSPTPKHQYQYLWITSCIVQSHMLDSIIHENQQHPNLSALKNLHFQSRSIYSILKAVELFYLNRLVHLDIQLNVFFFDDTKATTNWKISSFTSVHHEDANITHHQPNSCTAPELLLGPGLASSKMDSWSVGCVLYTFITGLPLFQSTKEIRELLVSRSIEQYIEIALYKVEDDFFKQILLMLLTLSQTDRKTVSEVVQFCDSHSNYYQ